MNRQTIIIVIIVVALVHVAFFYAATHMSPRPKVRIMPQPNFGVSEQVYSDSATGDKVTYREISVSTKLADPAVLQRFDEERAKAKATPAPGP